MVIPAPKEDPYTTALKSGRLVYVRGDIDGERLDKFRESVTGALKTGRDPLCVVLSTHGGNPDYGWPMYDELRRLSGVIPVTMVASGPINSMGIYLLLAVPVNDRYALPHATFYIHRGRQSYERKESGYGENQAYELLESAAKVKQYHRLQQALDALLAEGTGLSNVEVRAIRERPTFLSTRRAKKIGLIGHILS